MAEKTCILHLETKPIKILKWKVQEGISIPLGRVLLLYDFVGAQKQEQRKLKSTQAGIVHKIVAQEGDGVKPGDVLLELRACCHPTIMNDMCAECGADLRKYDIISTASVPMIHAIPDLKVSEEVALRLGRADNERLIKDKKLVLLVDLDQTLIHTTNDNIPPNIKDVCHFQLHGPNSPWYHTRLRPGTHKFLNNIHDFYELHICTFGARHYAHTIAMFLDADKKIFSNRILSRDECFDPTSKKANLKALFPCGDNMVCIIDDREDVWSHASNLIHVKPYHFFQHTGDINAPPGLDKHENDNEAGVDLTKIRTKITGNEVSSQVKETNGSENVQNNLENGEEDISNKTEKLSNDVKKQVSCNGKKEAVETTEEPGQECENKSSNTETNSDDKDMTNGDNENNLKINNNVSSDNPDKKDDVEDKESVASKEKSKSHIVNNSKVTSTTEETKNIEKPSDVEVQNKTKAEEKQSGEDNLIEIDDSDDYLIYLEDILKRIHEEFYLEFEEMEPGETPDLKTVIPRVRGNVLSGCSLVFSGLVPTHMKLEYSKAYQVAISLGAKVSQDINKSTTHLVAVRPGTVKVNAGKRKKNLKVVTPDWLWCCAERWEHVDERIFPLKRKGSKNRHPPPHCGSPEHFASQESSKRRLRKKRTPSGRFMDTINPLMSFSSADIADMDKEVEDILDDESDSSENEANKRKTVDERVSEIMNSSGSSSSEDSLTGEYPKGYKRKREEDDNLLDEYNNSTEEDDSPSVKFRRGEMLDDLLDMEQEDTRDSQGSIEPPDEVDDGVWNMMGAALEREFLSNE